MKRITKDSTGMTATQAIKEAELRFTKDKTLAGVFAGNVISVRAYPCSGQAMYAGRKTTRGCGHSTHLQPCPGGPLVFEIIRSNGMFNCIEAQSDSWREAIAKIDQRRADDRAKFEQYKQEREAAEAAAKKPRKRRSVMP